MNMIRTVVTASGDLESLGDTKVLTSQDLFDLSESFSQLASLFSAEENSLLQGGVTAEEELKLSQVSSTRIKLENISSVLGDIAFTIRVEVDLNNYNQEIISSTKALNRAAKRIQSIRNTINDFVKAFEVLIDTTNAITSGGSFSFDGTFNTVIGLLETAGIDLGV